jgi:hypothetical protein
MMSPPIIGSALCFTYSTNLSQFFALCHQHRIVIREFLDLHANSSTPIRDVDRFFVVTRLDGARAFLSAEPFVCTDVFAPVAIGWLLLRFLLASLSELRDLALLAIVFSPLH